MLLEHVRYHVGFIKITLNHRDSNIRLVLSTKKTFA